MAVELVQADRKEIPLQLKERIFRTFKTLRHRNFRLYFCGQLISLSGTWMQHVAVSWLVYRLTNSALMLGVIGFARLVPMLLFGLAGGYLADRFDRKRIIILTQTIAMLAAATLAVLTVTGRVDVWHVISLTALIGIVSAFEMPAQQALVANMVEREELVNACSLNAFLFNCARTIAPVMAGVLVCWSGEAICFWLNSISFLASIFALAMIRIAASDQSPHGRTESSSLAMAIKFALSTPSVRNVLALALILTLFGMQYLMLLPVFSAEVLHGQATAFGVLTAAVGLGSFSAALLVANLPEGVALDRLIGNAMVAFFFALVTFSFSTSFYLSSVLLLVVAFFAALQLICSHSLIQLAVPDLLRGKVVSIYLMISIGVGPFGSLLVGWLAHDLGAPRTLSLCALVSGCAGLAYLWAGTRICRTAPAWHEAVGSGATNGSPKRAC